MSSQCNTCLQRFDSFEALRSHYKRPIHEYNLKRRVGGLPPVPEELFQRAQAAARARQPPTGRNEVNQGSRGGDGGEEPESHVWKCQLTGKRFKSRQQYEQHLRSKKYRKALEAYNSRHRDGSATQSATAPTKRTDTSTLQSTARAGAGAAAGDDEEPLDIRTHCLFCSHPVDGLADHFRHAEHEHSFFIADSKYLKDMPGLMQHMMRLVDGDHSCIYCDQHFPSTRACQQHMLERGHCKLPVDILGGDAMAEFDEFYDYDRKVRLGAAGYEARIEAHLAGRPPPDELPRRRTRSASGERKRRTAYSDGSDYDDPEASDEDEEENSVPHVLPSGEVMLPSGKIMGHRSLRVYYRQKLHRPATRRCVQLARKNEQERLLKSVGLLTAGTSLALSVGTADRRLCALARRAKEPQSIKRMKHEARARHERQRLDVGLRNNQLIRKHFRIQVMQ